MREEKDLSELVEEHEHINLKWVYAASATLLLVAAVGAGVLVNNRLEQDQIDRIDELEHASHALEKALDSRSATAQRLRVQLKRNGEAFRELLKELVDTGQISSTTAAGIGATSTSLPGSAGRRLPQDTGSAGTTPQSGETTPRPKPPPKASPPTSATPSPTPAPAPTPTKPPNICVQNPLAPVCVNLP